MKSIYLVVALVLGQMSWADQVNVKFHVFEGGAQNACENDESTFICQRQRCIEAVTYLASHTECQFKEKQAEETAEGTAKRLCDNNSSEKTSRAQSTAYQKQATTCKGKQ